MRTLEGRYGTTLTSRLALQVPLLLLAAGLGAQAKSPVTDFTTGDGSRFLLLATGGPPVVHWVVITPAGILEDPVGLGGLSHAAALSALAGTAKIGSLDPEAEPGLLREVDRLEQEVAALRRRRAEVSPELERQLAEARQAAASLSDPAAWWRLLLGAPASAIRHELLQDATVLSLSTTTSSLSEVARLLRERRENALLRGVHAELPQVRARAAAIRASTPTAELRAELLAMAFGGHPFGRLWARAGPPDPMTREAALDVWRRTQRPERGLHVLVGGFDPAAVRSRLGETFAKSGLNGEPVPGPPPIPAAAMNRRASVPGGSRAAIAVGIPLPAEFDRDALRAVTRWIADGEDSFVAKGLRENGYEEPRVQASAPFPSPSHGGLLLIEVEVQDSDPAARDRGRLRDAVATLLEAAVEQGPGDSDLRPIIAEMEARHTSVRGAADSLAYELAIQCGLLGRTSDEVLGPFVAPTRSACMQLIAGAGWKNRIEVEWELR